MIIVIDFDGTIVENAYPEIGNLRKNVKKVLQRLHEEGHEIIINTCRAGIFEGNVYSFLQQENIFFTYINCNIPWKIEQYGQDCRKISGDVYIDDKSLGGIPDDWEEIYTMLQKHPQYKS